TSPLPNKAILVRAVVKIKRMSSAGTDPFTTHGSLVADVVSGWFDGSSALESKDLQAAATTNKAGIFSAANGNGEWSTAEISGSGLGAINLTGKTQVRLRFTTDDDNDKAADYLNYASGDSADSSDWPVLKVEYTMP
ncbi:hypothetical protein HYS82_00670, partial [Candidatus Amesbacteria bacterium]|nr:hypothetical protein [Candidatus Amesbacteria bacterium]